MAFPSRAQKLLIARLKGGIGNQLFIYAAAKSFSKRTNRTLVFDIQTGFWLDRKYKRYPLIHKITVGVQKANFFQLFYFYLTKYAPSFAKRIINSFLFEEKNSLQMEDLVVIENSPLRYLFIDGYFQSYDYFKSDLDEIRGSLLLNSLSLKNDGGHLMKKINDSVSVAIHVRRMQYDSLLDFTYYERAKAWMVAQLGNAEFFIFSDDMDWCRNWFSNSDNVHFVENEQKDELVDLRLMAQCKHFIIANSTFSWWGAMLSMHSNKWVVAPQKTSIGVEGKFYPETWVLL